MSPLKIAHRGNHHGHAENSLAAIRSVVDSDLDGSEVDLLWHPKGEIFILHDESLARTHSIYSDLGSLSLTHLKNIHTPHSIPTLEELLTVGESKVLHLEIKIPDQFLLNSNYWNPMIEYLMEVLKKHPLPCGSTLASFSPHLLSTLNHHPLPLPLTGIAETETQLNIMESLPFLDFISIHESLVKQSNRAARETWIWGTDKMQTIEYLSDDWHGIISDHFSPN